MYIVTALGYFPARRCTGPWCRPSQDTTRSRVLDLGRRPVPSQSHCRRFIVPPASVLRFETDSNKWRSALVSEPSRPRSDRTRPRTPASTAGTTTTRTTTAAGAGPTYSVSAVRRGGRPTRTTGTHLRAEVGSIKAQASLRRFRGQPSDARPGPNGSCPLRALRLPTRLVTRGHGLGGTGTRWRWRERRADYFERGFRHKSDRQALLALEL